MSIVKINQLAVKDGQAEELERRFAARKHSVDQAPGFEGFELLRPTGEGQQHYFVLTRWVDEASFEAWAAQRHARDPQSTVSRAEGILSFEVVDFTVSPGSSQGG